MGISASGLSGLGSHALSSLEEGQPGQPGGCGGGPDEGSRLWADSWYADQDLPCLSGPESPFPEGVAPLPIAGPTPPRSDPFPPLSSTFCMLRLRVPVCMHVCMCVLPAVGRGINRPSPSRKTQVISFTFLFLSLCSPPFKVLRIRMLTPSPAPPTLWHGPNTEEWKLNHQFFPREQPKLLVSWGHITLGGSPRV